MNNLANYILAIDDDFGRYDGLRRLLDARTGPCPVTLITVSCPTCVAIALPDAIAILLDHDLDAEPCTCGNYAGTDSTREYLPAIVAHDAPVIVTSCSDSENRAWLATRLHAAGTPVLRHSANEIQPEYHWIGWLWTQGVL